MIQYEKSIAKPAGAAGGQDEQDMQPLAATPGLADGQHCDVHVLQAVLFSMYSMPPTCNCSCFACKGIVIRQTWFFVPV